jgi:hypothetical protein
MGQTWCSNPCLFRSGRRGYLSVVKLLIGLAYLAIGLVVASTHHYFGHLGDIKSIVSALLAVVLWPLVLFGVNLHLGHVAHAKGK